MITKFSAFDPTTFSFHDDPVLVLEEFWDADERNRFRKAMQQSKWTALAEMPPVAAAFKDCGNWLKSEIRPDEGNYFMSRVGLPCIAEYVESFPNIKGRHVNFNYYSYGVGDCLSTHDDTDNAYSYAEGKQPPTRRLALATYFHEQWETDWGGELIIYKEKPDFQKTRQLEVVCNASPPLPGSISYLRRSTPPSRLPRRSARRRTQTPLHRGLVHDCLGNL